MWSSFSSRFRSKAPIIVAAALLIGATAAPCAEPEVRIDIQKQPERKLRIALPPFLGREKSPGDLNALRGILREDLSLSGFFTVLGELPPGTPTNGAEMMSNTATFDKLAAAGAEFLVNVRMRAEGGKLVMEGSVFDTGAASNVIRKAWSGPEGSSIRMVHLLAGEIIQKLIGVRPLTRSRLAFLWKDSGKKQVFVGDYDGRNPRAISPAGSLALFPEWLPDGRAIVYTSFASGFPELIYRDVDSGYQKVLSSFPGMNANIAMAPDGQSLLATLSKDGNPEIYRLDLRGNVLARMTFDPGVDTSPTYSPNGREFAFVSDRSGSPQIYVMSNAGGKPTRITFEGGYNVSPDWSPSGKYIAYSSRVEGVFQLMLINPANGELIQLTADPGNKEDPDWGVDERHLVFTLTRKFKSDLFVLDIYSKETTQITRGKGNFSSPSWSSGNP